LTNKKADYVRNWIVGQLKIRAVVGLPANCFSALGANIKTCLLLARKWRLGEERSVSYPMWIAELESIGIDSAGKSSDVSDIAEASSAFAQFVREHGW